MSELDPNMNLDPQPDKDLRPNNIHKKSPAAAWVWMAIAILYAISPIDLIPDAIPFLGWFDDLFGIGAASMNLMQAYSANKGSSIYQFFKYLKWGFVILGILGIAIIALVVVGIAKLIQSM